MEHKQNREVISCLETKGCCSELHTILSRNKAPTVWWKNSSIHWHCSAVLQANSSVNDAVNNRGSIWCQIRQRKVWERENRDPFIQPTMQGFQARNLDIINNTYSLSSAAACRGVKVQEGEAWYCWHRHRNHSDILTSSLGSSLKWRKLFSLNGLERAVCREC